MNLLIILVAKYVFLVSFVIAGIYFLKQNRAIQKKILIFACISLPILYVCLLLAGYLYYDPRPFVVGNFTPLISHAADNGFPSDHVLLVSAIAAIVMYFNRRIGLVLWVIALLVASARVLAGVHHPIDVIASMLITLIVTAVTYLFLRNSSTFT